MEAPEEDEVHIILMGTNAGKLYSTAAMIFHELADREPKLELRENLRKTAFDYQYLLDKELGKQLTQERNLGEQWITLPDNIEEEQMYEMATKVLHFLSERETDYERKTYYKGELDVLREAWATLLKNKQQKE